MNTEDLTGAYRRGQWDSNGAGVSSEVVRVLPSQRERAAAVVTRAFLGDPIYTYTFPDAAERERCLGRYMAAFLGFALRYGEVQTTPNLAGVACWLSPWKAKPVLWQVLRTGFAVPRATLAFPKQSREKMVALASYLSQAHVRAVRGRHWHLAALAVDPPHQGRGIGTQLIQPILRRADVDGLPCYLDTQSERNALFYEKFGFAVVSEGEVPGHPIKIWAMVRSPRR